MAELRLAFAMLAGCSSASAGPTTVAGPTGWPAIDAIATAIGSAAKADAVGAWGDTARGCYAIAVELRGGGDATKVVDGIAAAGIATKDVVYEGDGVTLAVARAPFEGRVRADAGNRGAISARACFWNEREPAACEAACAGWLK